MFYYGIVVGLLSFGGFVYVIYVLYDGNIGNGCNDYGMRKLKLFLCILNNFFY